MNPRVFHHVRYERIEDWLRCGWMIAIPNAPMHHHAYGQMLEWLCDCRMARPQ